MMSATELLEQVKRLPANERWEIAHQLWDTLSDDQGVPLEGAALTTPQLSDELRQRQELVESGNFVAYDAKESMARVRRMLEEFRPS
jgi:hypothetical protein